MFGVNPLLPGPLCGPPPSDVFSFFFSSFSFFPPFFFFSPLLLSFSPSSFFPLSFLSFFSFLFPSSSFCYPPLSLLPFGAVTMENTQSRQSSKIMKINWKTKQRRPRPPSAAIKTGVRKTEPKNGAFAIGIQFFFFFLGCVCLVEFG